MPEADRQAAALGAHDVTDGLELKGCHVPQQDGPGNGELDAQSDSQLTVGLEKQASATEINGGSGSGIQRLAAVCQLPAHAECHRVTPVESPASRRDSRDAFRGRGLPWFHT